MHGCFGRTLQLIIFYSFAVLEFHSLDDICQKLVASPAATFPSASRPSSVPSCDGHRFSSLPSSDAPWQTPSNRVRCPDMLAVHRRETIKWEHPVSFTRQFVAFGYFAWQRSRTAQKLCSLYPASQPSRCDAVPLSTVIDSVTGPKQLTNILRNLKHVPFALRISRLTADRDRSGSAWAGPARSSALFRPLEAEYPSSDYEAVH